MLPNHANFVEHVTRVEGSEQLWTKFSYWIYLHWVILQGHINMLIIFKLSNQFNKPVKHDLWRHTYPKRKIHWHIWLQLRQALDKLHIHKQHSLHSIAWLLKSSPYPGSSLNRERRMGRAHNASYHTTKLELDKSGCKKCNFKIEQTKLEVFRALILSLRVSQWNHSNMDTNGIKIIVLISEVSLFQGENIIFM